VTSRGKLRVGHSGRAADRDPAVHVESDHMPSWADENPRAYRAGTHTTHIRNRTGGKVL
jgi:hypothetical protein